MLSAETSALVAGGGIRPPAPAAPRIALRVVRAVMWGGQRVEVGGEITADRYEAAELVTAGKAERIAAAPSAAAPTQPAAKPPKEKPRAQQ